EWAMTTVDNLVFSRTLAIEKFAAGSFVVFCDHAHRVKAAVLTRIILGANATIRSIPRKVSWRTLALEPVSIVCEAVCAVTPPLRKALSRLAAWSKGVTLRLPTPDSRLTAYAARR
ncbi:MAG TPA: hypothetical protein VH087_09155, partial [Thermoanaerobaculia bacterium]|nr:hypothetical protein [Thermoanaerobaculia bacterium]